MVTPFEGMVKLAFHLTVFFLHLQFLSERKLEGIIARHGKHQYSLYLDFEGASRRIESWKRVVRIDGYFQLAEVK